MTPHQPAQPITAIVPDSVYVELIDAIYTALLPVLTMGTAFAVLGTLVAVRTGDVMILWLTVIAALWSFGRAVIMLAYRRARAVRPLDHSAARRWEGFYAAGSYISAAMLGAFDVRAIAIADPTAQMLATALIFGYGSGVILRVSVRPWICIPSLMIAVIPTVIAMLVKSTTPSPDQGAYLVQALVMIFFTIASLEAATHLHRTLLAQFLSKSQLAGMARTDALTGLANRILLRERFEEELAQAEGGRMLALHFIDLDRFKVVNDDLGHSTGDAVLQQVAHRLIGLLGTRDVAARIGGDEFMVMQVGISAPVEAERFARRIIHMLAAPYPTDGRAIRIGASVGIAFAPKDGRDLGQLLAGADEALYQAKSKARGSFAFWSASRRRATAA